MTFRDFSTGRFYNGDCLEIMKEIPDGCIDMILCDLPYGTTQNKWDSIIQLDLLWAQYWRIAKPNAAIVLTAQQPFTTALIMSQIELFRYCWYWRKNKTTGHLNAKKMPLKAFEDVCIFYKSLPIYNPQMTIGKLHGTGGAAKIDVTSNYGRQTEIKPPKQSNEYFPNNELSFGVQYYPIHPTQKPVALFEYLIKTYSNEEMLILDNTAGSGTTAIAAININRRWVCIEQDTEYYTKACERIENHGLPTEAAPSVSTIEVPIPEDA